MDFGLLIIRVVFGLVMAAHGSQKLFGWFGGYGLTGTGGFFDQLGFRPGRFFAAIAGMTETFGGLLFVLGFLAPVASIAIISVMIVAIGSVHAGNGLFAATNGIEVPLLYASAAAGLALTGPGAYSFDAAFGLVAVYTLFVKVTAIGIGVLGGVGNLMARRPVPQQA